MYDRDRDSQTMSAGCLLAGAVLLTPHSPNRHRRDRGAPKPRKKKQKRYDYVPMKTSAASPIPMSNMRVQLSGWFNSIPAGNAEIG